MTYLPAWFGIDPAPAKTSYVIEEMADEDQDIATVAEKIIRYLRIHPEAADTAEGVARWWLRRQHYEETVELVGKALERLLKEGMVIQTITRNGNTIYRRRRQKAPTTRSRKNETLH